MPKIDGRTQRGALTRARVLDAARALLPEVGVEFTLDRLAAELGMTKQAILHHFPSKERVFVELALDVVARERDVATAAVAGRRGADALEAFVRALVGFYCADIDGFRVVYLRGQLVSDGLKWFPLAERAARLYPVTGEMYGAVEAAMRAGGAGPAGVDARALVVCAHLAALGFATMYGTTVAIGDPMKRGPDAYLDTFLATWRAGLEGTRAGVQGSMEADRPPG